MKNPLPDLPDSDWEEMSQEEREKIIKDIKSVPPLTKS